MVGEPGESEPAEGRGAPGAVERALDVLRVVVESEAPVSLADVAKACRIPKPTAHRILRLLVDQHLLRQDVERQYVVGRDMYRLAGHVWANLDYTSAAERELDYLQSLTPETIHVAVLAGDELICTVKREGRQAYRMASGIGMTLPFHCTAIGKSVLAFVSDTQRLASPESLLKRTPKTITDPAKLKSELVRVRAKGFAIDDEENEVKVRCVGAPIFNVLGDVVGGISVAAPTFNFSLRDAQELAPAVIDTATRVSKALGGEQPTPRPRKS